MTDSSAIASQPSTGATVSVEGFLLFALPPRPTLHYAPLNPNAYVLYLNSQPPARSGFSQRYREQENEPTKNTKNTKDKTSERA